MVYMHEYGVLNLSRNGRQVNLSKGTGTGLLNYHIKKGNMMVLMMDLDQNLFSSTASFGGSFCFP